MFLFLYEVADYEENNSVQSQRVYFVLFFWSRSKQVVRVAQREQCGSVTGNNSTIKIM